MPPRGCDLHAARLPLASASAIATAAAKYASLHPNPDATSKVPVLEDVDGTALFESLVVAYYLNEKYPEPALLPSDAAAKAKVLDDCSSSRKRMFCLGDFAPWQAPTRHAVMRGCDPGAVGRIPG